MPQHSSEIAVQLEKWYSSSNGRYLLAALEDVLKAQLGTAFGYHVMQLGVSRDHPLFGASQINHRIYAAESGGGRVGLVTRADELPIESDSIDVLIAHHCLEFADNPHQVLREMQRVLAPQGHMVIIGLNPFSALGAGLQVRRLLRQSLWSDHSPVSVGRVKDWLSLLGCHVTESSYFYALPPVGGGALRRAMLHCDRWLNQTNAPIGGCYAVHAVKQVVQRNRPKPRFLPATGRLMGLGVSRPASSPSPVPKITPNKKGDVAA